MIHDHLMATILETDLIIYTATCDKCGDGFSKSEANPEALQASLKKKGWVVERGSILCVECNI